MAARATLREVALDAGVSPSTVSRALAGNPAISKRTRDRVFHSAAKLNYVPNLQARGLRSAASDVYKRQLRVCPDRVGC